MGSTRSLVENDPFRSAVTYFVVFHDLDPMRTTDLDQIVDSDRPIAYLVLISSQLISRDRDGGIFMALHTLQDTFSSRASFIAIRRHSRG
jgi:hypothetical protein